MPVFNAESFLERSIESILQQSYPILQFIIINDGSKDGSADIIRRYADRDKRIMFIDRRENKGLVYTLNEGLSHCKGEFIARMDADDYSHKDRFEIQLNYLNSNTDIQILGSSYRVIVQDRSTRSIVRVYPRLYFGFKNMINTFLCHPSVIFRKSIINNMPAYQNFEAEDFEFFSRILLHFRGFNLPNVLLDYREHELNRSSQAKEEIRESTKIIFRRNYNELCGNLFLSDRVFDFFENRKRLSLYTPLVVLKSVYMLNKLRKRYQIPLFAKENLLSLTHLFRESVKLDQYVR